MISKEEVQRIAKLARLELTEKEITRMQKDLSEILDYFNLLKKAPKVNVERKSVVGNSARPDKVAKRESSCVEKIITASPDKKDDYIKVKAIF